MARENLGPLRHAMDRLKHAERELLEKIAADNTPGDREQYREIRETLEAMESELHRKHSIVMRLLKRLHLVP